MASTRGSRGQIGSLLHADYEFCAGLLEVVLGLPSRSSRSERRLVGATGIEPIAGWAL